MKDRPILFSAPMVRAILSGRKTQTRRVVSDRVPAKHKHLGWTGQSDAKIVPLSFCPYGQAGDQLWVREAWRIGAWDYDTGSVALDYKADNAAVRGWITIPESEPAEVFNRLAEQSSNDADKAGRLLDEAGEYHWPVGESPCRWRPSIHMPRWAARITLEITGVRVERLNDISYEDGLAEGVADFAAFLGNAADMLTGETPDQTARRLRWPQRCYERLWNDIHGPRAWDKNPWVWVIEFRKAS